MFFSFTGESQRITLEVTMCDVMWMWMTASVFEFEKYVIFDSLSLGK